MFVDIHAHLDLLDDITDAVKQAKAKKVAVILTSGVDHETNRKALSLSTKYDIIKPCLGIYPPDALIKETGKEHNLDLPQEMDFIRSNADSILAIGECGLDYKTGSDKALQKKVFHAQIELAKELDKPLIVHSRKAEEDCIALLEESGYKKVLMHCFSGKLSLFERVRKNRWYFSIPTTVVRDEHFQRMVKETPLDRLFCETDSPFLSPYREKPNQPAFVVEAYKKVAEIKGLMSEEVMTVMWMNFGRLF